MNIRLPSWLLLAVLSLSHAAVAQELARPPGVWTDPEVIAAAVRIGMTPDQRDQFRVIVGEFLGELGRTVRKLIQRNNPANLPRKIKKKRDRLARDMDEKMAAILDDEQCARYEAYRDLLLEKMDARAAARRRR